MLRDLVSRWQEEATLFERRGQGEAARLLQSLAGELEQHLTQYELEQLTPAAAARETGYSPSQLRRLFPGEKKIRRKDLPKKPGRPGPRRPQAA